MDGILSLCDKKNWRQYEGAVKGAIEGGNMTQINVAGQKYTDGINGNIDYPLYDNLKKHILENEYLIGKVMVGFEQLKKDLDSTAKIQGDMLKREIDRATDVGILKADVAYIKGNLTPAESTNETPPAWEFLTKKYT